MPNSDLLGYNVRYHADCATPETRVIDCSMEIDGHFQGRYLDIEMPRWVPGSYVLREPLRLMQEMKACDVHNNELRIERKGTNGYRLTLQPKKKPQTVIFKWRTLATELTVRSNHLDSTHLHLLPTFTWPELVGAKEYDMFANSCKVSLTCPTEWLVSTQLPLIGVTDSSSTKTWEFEAPSRDELYDGVIEANANPPYSFDIEGVTHHLKLWDAGGASVDTKMVEKLAEDTKSIVAELFALYGVPEFDEYHLILHLTGGLRGGLEHLRSQSDQVPREALIEGNETEYKDLLGLISHEYVHVWNVKRLRPKNFIEYDLSKEVHTDLLWWFEGFTCWLGDIICLRSGVWSESDYLEKMSKKLKMHNADAGRLLQSVKTSSHEAWIQLYRRPDHPHHRESQVSYYLHGELVGHCLDSMMRRATNGERGLDTALSLAWKKHGLDGGGIESDLGIDIERIHAIISEVTEGARLRKRLNELISNPGELPLAKAFKEYGWNLTAPKPKGFEESGEEWLGISVSNKEGRVIVSNPYSIGPSRNILQPDDELLSINGLRITSLKDISKMLKGKAGQELSLLISRHGVVQEVKISATIKPRPMTELVGGGNHKWRLLIESRQ